ncbi:MBL fold metallo-hydrolase [Massilia sp. YIM B02763]|uniref:MBL fold metallo-hydrolase n=1 Tax=Massilia sp. YIM B02763 TaxID=3050130 RepID=UPI0025B6CE5B|nr:MBL fold metallo-hydrolase [Massilia sp. YIM B02763]MDN4056292.1 MBL fold metallo-hydrolase [Massilia sp. YIM B02763]
MSRNRMRKWTVLIPAVVLALAGSPGRAQDAAKPAAQGQVSSLRLPAASAPADSQASGSVQFIGTATVLIHYQGLTILTDPNFLHKGDHVHLGYGLTSERLTNPAIDLAQLPPIDLVILSHLHEDHFDKLVQEKLARNTPVVTTTGAAGKLKELGFTRTIGLATWDAVEVEKGEAKLRITAAPGRHGKAGMQALLPSVMGSVLDFGPNPATPSYRMYISGDTLVYDDLRNIPQRFPGIDLALLHLGGTRILGVFKVTMDGKDGVQLMQIVQPKKAIPIHYNDYDVFKSPLADFAREVQAAGLEQQVVYLAHGETYTFVPNRR